MNLTIHFTLEELTHSDIAIRKGIDNIPDTDTISNLQRLALMLEKVRTLLNKPIRINSAYRSVVVNEMVGSKATSQHCIGCAADIRVDGMTPDDIVKVIQKSDIQYDQLIREFDSWVHISIPNTKDLKPRRQILIIDHKGTRPYI